MFIAPVDATLGEPEWRAFVEAHPFGHLVAGGGPERLVPVVVPTQFVLAGQTVWLHLVRANPIFAVLDENPAVVLSVADDWAFIPSAWKAIDGEDPALGIPTTYYGAVQLEGRAWVHDERTAPGTVAAILRRQLATFQPDVEAADPAEAHGPNSSGSWGSRSGSSGSVRSSSTAGTSTGRTGGRWSSISGTGARPGTGQPPNTRCADSRRTEHGAKRRSNRRHYRA